MEMEAMAVVSSKVLNEVFGVDELSALRQDDWGGEDEKAISPEVLNNLEKLLNWFPDYSGITPSCTGSIGVVYQNSEKYMYIELIDDMAHLYCERSETSEVEICEEDLSYPAMLEKASFFWCA